MANLLINFYSPIFVLFYVKLKRKRRSLSFCNNLQNSVMVVCHVMFRVFYNKSSVTKRDHYKLLSAKIFILHDSSEVEIIITLFTSAYKIAENNDLTQIMPPLHRSSGLDPCRTHETLRVQPYILPPCQQF